jgi:hypothetical protein
MKLFIKLCFLVFCMFLLGTTACRKTKTYEGKAIIVSRSIDTTLKDSALIYGTVCSADNENLRLVNAAIWIDGTNIKTTSNDTGFFNIKFLPNTYTIKYLGQYYSADMTGELANIAVLPNEKIEVKFLQKVVVE